MSAVVAIPGRWDVAVMDLGLSAFQVPCAEG